MEEIKELFTSKEANVLIVLFLIFWVLKTIGIIDWSWWWILSPLAPFVIVIIATIIMFIQDLF